MSLWDTPADPEVFRDLDAAIEALTEDELAAIVREACERAKLELPALLKPYQGHSTVALRLPWWARR